MRTLKDYPKTDYESRDDFSELYDKYGSQNRGLDIDTDDRGMYEDKSFRDMVLGLD